jgi:hypothetical protein
VPWARVAPTPAYAPATYFQLLPCWRSYGWHCVDIRRQMLTAPYYDPFNFPFPA